MTDPCHPAAAAVRRASDADWLAFLRSHRGWHAPAKAAAAAVLSSGVMLACGPSTPRPSGPGPGRFWPGEAGGEARPVNTVVNTPAPARAGQPSPEPDSRRLLPGGAGPWAAGQPLDAASAGRGQGWGAGPGMAHETLLAASGSLAPLLEASASNVLEPNASSVLPLPLDVPSFPGPGDAVLPVAPDLPRAVPTPGGLACVLAAAVAAVAWGGRRIRNNRYGKGGMDHHRLTEGCRELTAAEAALLAEAKVLGAMLGSFVARLRSAPDAEERWVSIGETHLQQGVMALVRSVARPAGF